MNVQGCLRQELVEDPCAEEFNMAYWGIYNEDILLEPESGWYPTFSEGSYCANDGEAPAFMVTNPKLWKHKTNVECC